MDQAEVQVRMFRWRESRVRAPTVGGSTEGANQLEGSSMGVGSVGGAGTLGASRCKAFRTRHGWLLLRRYALVVARIQAGSRVVTKDGEIGRVMRLDPDGTIAFVQLDDSPKPDGTPLDVAELKLLEPDWS
jgi:hypothetical protein